MVYLTPGTLFHFPTPPVFQWGPEVHKTTVEGPPDLFPPPTHKRKGKKGLGTTLTLVMVLALIVASFVSLTLEFKSLNPYSYMQYKGGSRVWQRGTRAA